MAGFGLGDALGGGGAEMALGRGVRGESCSRGNRACSRGLILRKSMFASGKWEVEMSGVWGGVSWVGAEMAGGEGRFYWSFSV